MKNINIFLKIKVIGPYCLYVVYKFLMRPKNLVASTNMSWRMFFFRLVEIVNDHFFKLRADSSSGNRA